MVCCHSPWLAGAHVRRHACDPRQLSLAPDHGQPGSLQKAYLDRCILWQLGTKLPATPSGHLAPSSFLIGIYPAPIHGFDGRLGAPIGCWVCCLPATLRHHACGPFPTSHHHGLPLERQRGTSGSLDEQAGWNLKCPLPATAILLDTPLEHLRAQAGRF